MSLHNLKWDDRFDFDYFEQGPETGISLYQNFRWMPELAVPMARRLLEMYPDCSFLDFGCAKGFLVRALRMLGAEAYGFDVSAYAIGSSNGGFGKYLYGPGSTNEMPKTDVIFAKDTLEHLFYDNIDSVLKSLSKRCKEAFFIVPLGENDRYRIPEYEKDATHIIREDESWWDNHLVDAGFKIANFSYTAKYFKENWNHYETGNGFYRLHGRLKNN